ncbi:MAG: hypothetical protein AAFY41_04315 [Bacteroidota bacterium]
MIGQNDKAIEWAAVRPDTLISDDACWAQWIRAYSLKLTIVTVPLWVLFAVH